MSVTTETPSYIGTNTTLKCSITLNHDAVDTTVNIGRIDVTWMGPQGRLSSNGTIAISEATVSSNVYESTLTLSPLMNTAAGNYTCEAIMIPVPDQFLLTSRTGHGIRTISVEGKVNVLHFLCIHKQFLCLRVQ